MAESSNSELQRLLATLNGYAPSTSASSVNTELYDHSPEVNPPTNMDITAQMIGIPGLGFLPSEPPPITVSKATTTASQDVFTPKPNDTLNTTLQRSTTPVKSSRGKSPAPNIPDASGITTWPAALKHVSKHLANNDKVSTRIQHLIVEQHKHERQWWDGREALTALHQNRTGTSAQVSALLRSLGGKDTFSAPNDPKANQAELDAYDAKVYKSLLNMTADFDRQLRALGIPFFAIKHEHVILEVGKQKADAVKGRLDKGELRELQRRMLQHLEDLFGD